MALLLPPCGYETGEIGELGVTVLAGSGQSQVVASSPTPRSGGFCLRTILTQSSNNHAAYQRFTFAAGVSEINMRFGVFPNILTNDTNVGVIRVLSSSGAVILGVRYLRTSQVLTFSREGYFGTELGSTSILVPLAEWSSVRIVYVPHATTGILQVYVRNRLALDFAGNTDNNSLDVRHVDMGLERFPVGTNNSFMAYDDIVFDDADLPPDGSVLYLKPNGAGSSTQLSRGGTDSGANWSQVDEVPPNEGVDYVFGQDADVGLRDLYAIENLPPNVKTVNSVAVIAKAALDAAGSGSIGLTQKSGATTTEGTAQALDTAYAFFRDLRTTNPATGSAYTPSEADSLEVGVTIR